MKTIFFSVICVGLMMCTGSAFAQEVSVASNSVTEEELSNAMGNLSEKLNITEDKISPSPEVMKDILRDADKILAEAVDKKTLFGKERDVGDVKDSDSLTDTPVRLARLLILNKITGRIEEKIAETGVEMEYGTLSIKLYDCVQTVSDRHRDATALLEVMEKAPEDFVNMSLVGKELEVGKKIFFGWMLKSAPAVSSLEHPVYDITLKNCGV